MLNKRGSTQVIVLIFMTVILGVTALVIDIGNVYIQRAKLNNATDAASLAGGLELPENPQKAYIIAQEYLDKNIKDLSGFNITIFENNSALKVESNKNVNHFFAKVLGINSSDVRASSTSKVGAITEVYDSIRPLVVQDQVLEYGKQVILKEDAGDGYSGNYGAVSLGGTGSNIFENNVKYGYNSRLSVGDVIYTETGNMSGATVKGVKHINDSNYETFINHSKHSNRLWVIPVVDTLVLSGKKSVTIVGFAQFFVEDAYTQNGRTEIVGRFVEFVKNGKLDFDQTDYGLRAVKLVD